MAEFTTDTIDTWVADYITKMEVQMIWAAKAGLPVPPPLDPEIKAALPDVCRRAAKRIANQPVLWCKRAFHLSFSPDGDETPRDWLGRFISLDELPNNQQACAMGHIEDILTEDFGERAMAGANMRWAGNEINEASRKATGLVVPAANDRQDATPTSIADHLYVVADHLEFSDD